MAYGPTGTVRIRGLAELNRALKKMEGNVPKEVRKVLLEIAEPVRIRAEQLAATKISHNTERWSAMRVGSTVRVVYVAPRARRRGGSPRPNMGTLLMTKAMLPALEQEEAIVVRKVEYALDVLGAKAGF